MLQVKVVGPPVRGDGTRSPFMGVEIRGTDGACTERPAREAVWSIGGTLTSDDTISVDFSPKGGPKTLAGKLTKDKNGIVFPDGNTWVKQPNGTPNRLPKDLSTLKSD